MNSYYKYEPVELTFFKFSMHCEDNKEQIKKYYEKFTGANSGGYRIYESLGMYSNIVIRRKKESISLDTIKSFLEDNNEGFNANYYTYKIAMSHLYSSGDELGLGEHPGAIMQLQLKNNNIDLIKKGYKQIKDQVKECGAVYEIYKVLGPNDFLVIFKGMHLDKIFELKRKFLSYTDTKFRRVNVMLFATTNFTKYTNEKLPDIQLVSNIRLKDNIDIPSLKQIINEQDKTGNVNRLVDYELYDTLGVIDVEIKWGMEDFSKIKNIFLDLSEYISDEQTDCFRLSK